MSKSIFEFISDIFEKKTPWDDLSESDKKSFNTYMLNRWISMNPDYTEFINMIQQYSIGILNPREVYKLYQDILPKSKFYVKYVKGDEVNKDFNDSLIEFMADKMEWSQYRTVQYLELLKIIDTGNILLKEFIGKYGVDAPTLKKQFGLK